MYLEDQDAEIIPNRDLPTVQPIRLPPFSQGGLHYLGKLELHGDENLVRKKRSSLSQPRSAYSCQNDS
jgi:hypothetical protein